MKASARTADGHKLHARFDGPIVMIGFGSIGKGALPLIERHMAFHHLKFRISFISRGKRTHCEPVWWLRCLV